MQNFSKLDHDLHCRLFCLNNQLLFPFNGHILITQFPQPRGPPPQSPPLSTLSIHGRPRTNAKSSSSQHSRILPNCYSLLSLLNPLIHPHQASWLFMSMSSLFLGCKLLEGRVRSDSNSHLLRNSAYCLAQCDYSTVFLQSKS